MEQWCTIRNEERGTKHSNSPLNKNATNRSSELDTIVWNKEKKQQHNRNSDSGVYH